MAGKIVINTEKCKGCRLCVGVCPQDCIVISESSNGYGYLPAESNGGRCTGCAMCAVMCPEAVIEVYQDSKVIEIKAVGGKKKKLIREEV